MNKKYSPLFTPWKIGKVEIKNRIVMTSMGGTSIFGWMEPNHFDKEAANFLLERAKNNAGLILPGIAPIKDLIMGKWLYKGKSKFKKLAKYMEEFHKTGCKLFIQMTAGFGRSMAINSMMIKASHNKFLATLLKPIVNVPYITASASENPNRWDNTCTSRPLTIEEINKIVEGFAKTAKLLKDAGVDGVEVHAVHEGYLLDQFTTAYTNRRTDQYGGSFENRYRFPAEIVKAIKKECGSDFPVSLRYSVVSKTKAFQYGALPGEKFKEIGRDMAESKKAAKYLQDAGYDMLNCDNGTYDAWYWAHPAPYMPNNCNLKDVEEIKKVVHIPVVCAGKMTCDVAATAIAQKKIDAMGVARQFLVDPEWITKLMNGKENTIMPCINCHNGCFNLSHYEGIGNGQSLKDTSGMAQCALNPRTMQSKKYKIVPTKTPKEIAIIGGGIGGMEVARVAALRGHKPTIYEKTSKLGGVFIWAATPDFKEHDRELLKWYEQEMKRLNIRVMLNSNIDDASRVKADKVIVATGATARKLKMPGIENAMEACDYLRGKKVGQTVVIVGGGLTGCEIALDLCHKHKTPIIVEMKNDLIAAKGVSLANSSYLRDFFKTNNVEVHLNSSVSQMTKNSVTVKSQDGKEQVIKCDSIIVSAGYIPQPLAPKGYDLVGDCNHVGNLKTVIWNAWDVAMKL